MHDPSRNPTLKGKSGRAQRHVNHSICIRNVRTDTLAERHLKTLGEVLAGATAADRVSVSMLMRRALAVYASHIAAVRETPVLIATEKLRVREGTNLPNPNPSSRRANQTRTTA